MIRSHRIIVIRDGSVDYLVRFTEIRRSASYILFPLTQVEEAKFRISQNAILTTVEAGTYIR